MKRPEPSCWQCPRHTMTCRENCEEWQDYEQKLTAYRQECARQRSEKEYTEYTGEQIRRRHR